eukprot:TRINITY_DN37539_c0_g1_i1.p1 TRINITY_DN37539_c0_g1~~TRINITY_DN37539_c0_g1_i1.p1  ORF type:complete len:215 (+),score=53.20 TRINITY_DN37539_c0_g1_i1:43-687(+)
MLRRTAFRLSNLGFPDFVWEGKAEENWKAQHGKLDGPVEEVSKQWVEDAFAHRTLEQKLMEDLIAVDVRDRTEISKTKRIEVDIDSTYCVPYDELDYSLNNLSARQWYNKYIVPRFRPSDTFILYGKNSNDQRPFAAARLLKERHNFENVYVFTAGFEGWYGEYPQFIEEREKKIQKLKEEEAKEKDRLEQRRRQELERYRRERERAKRDDQRR